MNLTNKRLKRLIKETIQDTITQQPSKENLINTIIDVLKANPVLTASLKNMSPNELENNFDAAKNQAQLTEGFFGATAKGIRHIAKHGLDDISKNMLITDYTISAPIIGGLSGGIASLLKVLAGADVSPVKWTAVMAALVAAGITADTIHDAVESAEAEEQIKGLKR